MSNTNSTSNYLEKIACELDADENYRVLRKLKPRNFIYEPGQSEFRLGLYVDVETTGLDPEQDEIIELAMVPFSYGLDGKIFEIKEPYQAFQQPRLPIQSNITELTGITNEMVAGHKIDTEEVTSFVAEAHLIVAHNAHFDRRFLELFNKEFEAKPWACSMSQINWQQEGFEGLKLAYLLAGFGYFYDAHRAVDDCYAGIELLGTILPRSGAHAMSQLLEVARQTTWRIWAKNAPFELKDELKRRGYRWNGDGNSNPKAWYIDIADDAKESELIYLKNEIYKRDIDLPITKITAFNRFSDRF